MVRMVRTTTKRWKALEVRRYQTRKVQELVLEGSCVVEVANTSSCCTQPHRCGLTRDATTPFEAE
jgi:hypothetical protein